MSDKSAYAYLGRVFKELWTSPNKSGLEKIGTMAFVVLASPLIFAGVLTFYAWKFFARR